jgi:hypothetical protein
MKLFVLERPQSAPACVKIQVASFGVPYLWQTIFESARYTAKSFFNYGLFRTQYIYMNIFL